MYKFSDRKLVGGKQGRGDIDSSVDCLSGDQKVQPPATRSMRFSRSKANYLLVRFFFSKPEQLLSFYAMPWIHYVCRKFAMPTDRRSGGQACKLLGRLTIVSVPPWSTEECVAIARSTRGKPTDRFWWHVSECSLEIALMQSFAI